MVMIGTPLNLSVYNWTAQESLCKNLARWRSSFEGQYSQTFIYFHV